jgi:hypothetical protein
VPFDTQNRDPVKHFSISMMLPYSKRGDVRLKGGLRLLAESGQELEVRWSQCVLRAKIRGYKMPCKVPSLGSRDEPAVQPRQQEPNNFFRVSRRRDSKSLAVQDKLLDHLCMRATKQHGVAIILRIDQQV